MSRVGMVGTDHIAAPMVRLRVAKGHRICVTRRNEKVSAGLACRPAVSVAEPQEVIDRAEILCCRPAVAKDVRTPLTFRAEQRIVSVMASTSWASISWASISWASISWAGISWAGISWMDPARICARAPRTIRTIHLWVLEGGGCPPAAIGGTEPLAALCEPETPVTEGAGDTARNRHVALCAVAPGPVDPKAAVTAGLGNDQGDQRAAETYTAHAGSGFRAALETGAPGHLAKARDARAAPGPLSPQMVEGLRDGGARPALQTTLDAIGARLG